MSEKTPYNPNTDPSLGAPITVNFGDLPPAPLGIGTVEAAASPDHSERGAVNLEIFGGVVDRAALVINGLRRGITGARLRRAEEKADSLALSAEVHMEPPNAFLPDRRNALLDTGKADKARRAINPDLAPVTISQKAQSRRAARRESKAIVQRASTQYRLQRVYGDDIGTPDYEERVRAERQSALEKFRAVRGGDAFDKSVRVAERKTGLVESSAAGTDIPGRVIRARMGSAERRADRLPDHLDKLEAAADERRQAIQDRRQERRRNRANRRAAKAARRARNAGGVI